MRCFCQLSWSLDGERESAARSAEAPAAERSARESVTRPWVNATCSSLIWKIWSYDMFACLMFESLDSGQYPLAPVVNCFVGCEKKSHQRIFNDVKA